MKLTFPPALFLLFLGLKLGGFITWSWLWVTAPLWGGLALALVVLLILILLAVLGGSRTTWRFK